MKCRGCLGIGVWFVFFGVLAGCGSDGPPQTVRIEATLCSSVAMHSFPERYLFLVDRSPAMARLDLEGRRMIAVQDFINRYTASENSAFGIIRFSDHPNAVTEEFTKNFAMLAEGVAQLAGVDECQVEGCRDWRAALEMARAWIDSDLAGLPAHLSARVRYHVFLIAGGGPEPSISILEGVELAAALGAGSRTAPVRFYGISLDDPDDWEGSNRAVDLLDSMAKNKGGDFAAFFLPQQLNLWFADFPEPPVGEISPDLLVRNTRAVWREGGWLADVDEDGLADLLEVELGTDPESPDTDGDQLEDWLEVYLGGLGLTPLEASDPLLCSGLDRPWDDRDGDGWNTCEEALLGTRKDLFDTDGDGFGDRLEILAGTDPLRDDRDEDLDGDGFSNSEELLSGTDAQAVDESSGGGLTLVGSTVRPGVRIEWSQPAWIRGLEITWIEAPTGGVGELYFYPSGTLRQDGAVRHQPALAWLSPGDGDHGPEVPLVGLGEYVLWSACPCVERCEPGCGPGEFCSPRGICEPDPCELVYCQAGFRCDPIGATCERQGNSSVCSDWQCPFGSALGDGPPTGMMMVRVDPSLSPHGGAWCDRTPDSIPCDTDATCPAGSRCRAREPVMVSLEEARCRTFQVDNVPLVVSTFDPPGFASNQVEVIGRQSHAGVYPADLFRRAAIEVDVPRNADGVVRLGDREFRPVHE